MADESKDEIEKLKELISGLEADAKAIREKILKHNDLRGELRSVERALTEAHNELFRKERDV